MLLTSINSSTEVSTKKTRQTKEVAKSIRGGLTAKLMVLESQGLSIT